ncbi:MAG TPA: YraN family protein [Candidatus Baltobacteraceae bacterium]|nr:YraN family protein [Candidatus Baltobacteraceae bacterium]
MSLRSKALGNDAEERAAEFLTQRGLRIVARNLRSGGGEIDIVAVEQQTLVFVEVKARSGAHFGNALDAVDKRKRRRIRTMAENFLQFAPDFKKVRFDVVAIDEKNLVHYRGAFA